MGPRFLAEIRKGRQLRERFLVGMISWKKGMDGLTAPCDMCKPRAGPHPSTHFLASIVLLCKGCIENRTAEEFSCQ